jgi:glutathione S-transferase
MKLIIGNKNYSSWSLRPWLLLKQMEVDFVEEIIPLYSEGSKDKILAYASSGKVPILLHAGNVIWDSLAIAEYLAELFPASKILPEDQGARAHMRSVCAEMHSGFLAMRKEMPMNLKRSEKKLVSPEVQNDIARVCAIWEDCLNKYHGPFLFSNFTVADAFFAPLVTRFKTYQITLPAICEQYMKRILALPSLQEWYKAALKEEWVIEGH